MSLVLLGRGGVGGGPTGSLATDVMAKRISGRSSSIVRFPMAHPADLDPEAPVNVDGWAAQVYRLSDRVRMVAALVPGDSPSWPRQTGVMRVAIGAGEVPAAAGTYPTLDMSGMEIHLDIDGVAFIGALAEAIHEDKVAAIGPGLRSQTGPDLLRRKHYLVRFKRAGVVGPGTETTDYVACADVHVTTRVDMDFALVEVHFMNGAWRSTNNPFQENPSCSGPLHFDGLRVPRASLPSGYTAELFAQHPFSEVNGTDVVLIKPMPGALELHFMGSAGQYICRFGIWNPATVTATQGQEALRGYDRGWAVSGALAYHHNHAYGARESLILDLQAFRRGPQGEEIQWRETEHPGTDTWIRQDLLASSATDLLRGAWLAGVIHYSFNLTTTRRGWHHPYAPEDNGDVGGAAISGYTVGHQGRGAFEVQAILLESLATRLGHTQIDLDDGAALSGDKLAANNSAAWVDLAGGNPGAVGRLPYYSTNSSTKIAWLHPHLTPSYAPASWGGTNPQFRLAPTTRPWNTPYGGKSCPYRAAIDWSGVGGGGGWSPFAPSHMSRALIPIEQGIWLYDDPIAHRMLEQTACSNSMLGMTQYSIAGHVHDGYQSLIAPLHEIVDRNISPPNAGYYQMPTYHERLGSNFRIQAWAIEIATMWWVVAPPAERTRISPPPGVGNSWFRAMWRYCSTIFMLNGFCHRTEFNNNAYGPPPYDPVVFGPTDIPNRRGALYRGTYLPNGFTTGGHTTTVGLFVSYMSGALYGMKHGPMRDQIFRDANDHTIRVATNWARMARANFPTEAYKFPTYYPVMSVGENGQLDPPATSAQIEAGETRWNQYLNTGQLFGFRWWQGRCAEHGYRDTGDPAMFDVVAYEFGAPAGNEVAAFNAISAEYLAKYAELAYQRFPHSEANWRVGCLSELIHRREQRTT